MKSLWLLLLAFPVYADYPNYQGENGDRLVVGNDGSTHYERDNGSGYGYNANAPEQEPRHGFNDVQNGDRYEPIGYDQYVNTRTGQVTGR